jgi:uroporphyrinogen III methyltransferase/synthase
MTEGPHTAPSASAPLKGRSVVVTRAVEQASALTEPLIALGAEVLVMPVIAVAAPDDWDAADRAIERLDAYDWIVLTSTNGVEALDERMHLHGLRLADLAGRHIAAVGSATAQRLQELGVDPSLVPSTFRAEGLVEAMRAVGAEAGPRVLIARAAEAREVLPDELRALGFEVDVAPVYRVITVHPPAEVLERLAAGDVDAVVFASGGTARRFVHVLAEAGMDAATVLVGLVVASIGPVTTDALRESGIAVDVQASESTVTAVVNALVERFSGVSG